MQDPLITVHCTEGLSWKNIRIIIIIIYILNWLNFLICFILLLLLNKINFMSSKNGEASAIKAMMNILVNCLLMIINYYLSVTGIIKIINNYGVKLSKIL